jgi:hypothetical protein
MSRKIFIISWLMLFSICAYSQNKEQRNPSGTWKFEAPSAPEGYTSGKMSVTVSEKKNDLSLTFTGSDYKIVAENVKVTGENLTCKVYLEGQFIDISLKMISDLKMSGKAVYSDGEVSLTLTRQK